LSGRFDTDSAALATRISVHARFGQREINDWIFSELELDNGMRVLDLGCGTGKQALVSAKTVGSSGRVIAVDTSSESLNTLREAATASGVADRIDLWNTDFESFAERANDLTLDRAYACFALYYAKQPSVIIASVAHALTDAGIWFFCGPAADNNLELRNVIEEIGGRAPEFRSYMDEQGESDAAASFEHVSVSRFENPVRFGTEDDVHAYWSSYNLYDPALDNAFRDAIRRIFSKNGFFETTKRVTGVTARVPKRVASTGHAD
jgi:ubiquinone/menaquinone biosynthesis C-methylase UbiE